ncbi:MAG: lysophospholipid acyltransferase family protein [Eggerthellales bacterium]|nr:lysophospholipid acyltransferase family protein [Eggerthellales bacterium]
MAYKFEGFWDLPEARDPHNPTAPHIPYFLRRLFNAVIGTAFRIAFRFSCEGKEHVSQYFGTRGAVVVCNHACALDPAFLWITLMPEKMIRFMARENLFYKAKGFTGWMASHVGAFPVKRDSADRSAIKRGAAMLKRQEIVGIFPEGTRRGRGTADMRIHAGAAFIARMGKAPLVPSTIRNVEKIKPSGSKFIHFPKVTVVYGAPVTIDEFDFMPKDCRLEAASWFVMRECYALRDDVPNTQVDMAALFPQDQDFTEALVQFTAERNARLSQEG